MRARLWAAVFLVGYAAPAWAQTSTTTNCHVFGSTVNCNSYTMAPAPLPPIPIAPAPAQSGVDRFADGMIALRAAMAERAAHKAAEAPGGSNFQEFVRASVARAVREGDCETAKKTALAANDLNLADQAVRLCTPK